MVIDTESQFAVADNAVGQRFRTKVPKVGTLEHADAAGLLVWCSNGSGHGGRGKTLVEVDTVVTVCRSEYRGRSKIAHNELSGGDSEGG